MSAHLFFKLKISEMFLKVVILQDTLVYPEGRLPSQTQRKDRQWEFLFSLRVFSFAPNVAVHLKASALLDVLERLSGAQIPKGSLLFGFFSDFDSSVLSTKTPFACVRGIVICGLRGSAVSTPVWQGRNALM